MLTDDMLAVVQEFDAHLPLPSVLDSCHRAGFLMVVKLTTQKWDQSFDPLLLTTVEHCRYMELTHTFVFPQLSIISHQTPILVGKVPSFGF